MKTQILFFLAFLVLAANSAKLRSKTLDCQCTCPDCENNPVVIEAKGVLDSANSNLVDNLKNRDEAENKWVDDNNDWQAQIHSTICDLECKTSHAVEYTKQSGELIGEASVATSSTYEQLTELITKAIHANNNQLTFLSSFSTTQTIQQNINDVIKEIQTLEEHVYNLICQVDTQQYEFQTFVKNAFVNEDGIQAIIQGLVSANANNWPSQLEALNNLTQEELALLVALLQQLRQEEASRNTDLYNNAVEVDSLRTGTYNALNDICHARATYENAVNECERQDQINLYNTLIDRVVRCAVDEECIPIEVPDYEIPVVTLPPCECDLPVTVPPVKICPPCYPCPVDPEPPVLTPPICPPFERCPPVVTTPPPTKPPCGCKKP